MSLPVAPLPPQVRLSNQYTAVPIDASADVALAEIRSQGSQGNVFYVYALDRDGKLRGVVPIRRLLQAPPGATVAELSVPRVVAVPEGADNDTIADFFATYRFLALPVIDAEGRMKGVIELDAVPELLFEEFEGRVRNDVLHAFGLPSAGESGGLRLLGRRLPWLLVNVAGGLFGAWVSRLFEATLAEAVYLSFFIPIVLILADSMGVTATARAITHARNTGDTWAAFRQEVPLAAAAGLVIGVVVGGLSLVIVGKLAFAGLLAVVVPMTTTSAAVVGSLVPRLFVKLGADPASAAAPVVLAVADNTTLVVYLALGSWLLPLA